MKSREESFERLTGLFNITVTPFTETGELDVKALESAIVRVRDLGYSGLLIGGTYGEFPTMNTAERAILFRAVMAVVGDAMPVLLCTAHSDPRVVRELTALASELGGVPMVTAPYVSEITDDQIVDFFRAIAPSSRTGLMIYNAPGIGITLAPSLIERLAGLDGVVALKQGELSPTTVDILAGTVLGRIRVLAASDLVMLGPIAAGFDGVSSTNSCAIPELVLAVYRALRSGDAALAGRLHRAWYPLRACARAFGQPQSTKAAMALRGWAGGHVRAPLLDLGAPERAKIRNALALLTAEPAAGSITLVD
ncbi:dihydrodipicolinate synthase family protein [Telmatospirillum sp.]|uniref:dihydrodipicolinate synthase family protein n=1 Tax=Telmatospirillum sp. TaxID=2079197 RepID=UPI002842280C|nr:dihydrodipicolinate synthase family protein [Telmatospirillum sp.]MDR3439828.1 dihydrodipicolinate synthase family protein [Telmatospirillum sp.]